MPDAFPPNHFARPLRHRPVRSWRPLQGLLQALRWLVARVPRGLTWAGLAALGWLAVGVGFMAWLVWPTQVGWFLAGAVLSAVVCLPLRSRRLAAVEAVEQRFDAYRLADARTDLDTVGPISGQHRLVEPADGEAIPAPVELYDQDAQPAFQQGGVVHRGGPVLVQPWEIQQLITDRTPASSTGPVWVECRTCAGRGFFDAEPDKGLPWEQCPDCHEAGGKWGQS